MNISSLVIIWWNIYQGSLNSQLINQNLEVMSQRADILVLGEYDSSGILPSTLKLLKEKYPYQRVQSYGEDDGEVMFLSKVPFSSVDIKWFSQGGRFSLSADFEQFVLTTTHLTHNWLEIKNSYPKSIAKAVVLYKNLFDSENIVAKQVKELISHTKPYSNNLLIGDLNLFPSFLYIPTYSYRTLKKHYRESFVKNYHSWPAEGIDFLNDYPKIRLDHSLHRGESFSSVVSKVIFAEGSDHYPIETVVHFKK